MKKLFSFKKLDLLALVLAILLLTGLLSYYAYLNRPPKIPVTATEVKNETTYSHWRYNPPQNKTTGKGVITNEEELRKIWNDTIVILLLENKEIKGDTQYMPKIDFEKNTVIWVSDHALEGPVGDVSIAKVEETNDSISIFITPWLSDAIGTGLHLWTIPKTDKEIKIVINEPKCPYETNGECMLG